MQSKLQLTQEQKYWLALLGVLVMSSLISVGLFAARTAPSKHGPYTSLILNLILAWIPLIFAWVAFACSRLPKLTGHILVAICAILWLIFFPNSFYILTDFQHIAIRDTPTPVWYDVIMLLWFAWSGLFLGLLSLYFMQKIVRGWLGNIFSWVFATGAIVLSSMGVYVGRFMYKNSWNLIIDPAGLWRDIFNHVVQDGNQSLIFSIPFALLFVFIYVVLHIFGQLTGEHHNQE